MTHRIEWRVGSVSYAVEGRSVHEAVALWREMISRVASQEPKECLVYAEPSSPVTHVAYSTELPEDKPDKRQTKFFIPATSAPSGYEVLNQSGYARLEGDRVIIDCSVLLRRKD